VVGVSIVFSSAKGHNSFFPPLSRHAGYDVRMWKLFLLLFSDELPYEESPYSPSVLIMDRTAQSSLIPRQDVSLEPDDVSVLSFL